MQTQIFFVFLTIALYHGVAAVKPNFKMCVPHNHYDACVRLVNAQASNVAQLECVSGKDRMDCLELVNRRQADFLAADPEDMYVAANLNNEDFLVFSQIRTVEEPEADYRYEGIILVHKNSNIHSLSDLKGKKSCHTGFGRNVGYKIPVMKLKKYGVLQVSDDTVLSPVEKELDALSKLFAQSCLVGNYSPNADLNRLLKKRYPNLCALCEDPVKCNNSDKYSGYEGAIKCLAENGGDVAFTKVIFVRKFFGLSINNRPATTTAQANPDNYEYLCADGSRVPVTGKACSWAQRPWAGYIGNGDVKRRVARLQERVQEFYNATKASADKQAASELGVSEKLLVVSKADDITPGSHLNNAQYMDVIERDGSTAQKIRLCVQTDLEKTKCEVLAKAAYSRDVRPEFICVLPQDDCIRSVADNSSDVTFVTGSNQIRAKEAQLIRILEEAFDFNYLVVADKGISTDVLHKTTIKYQADDPKSRDAALQFNLARYYKQCNALTTHDASVRIVKSSKLSEEAVEDKHELICPDLSRKSISSKDAACIFDATPKTAVFVRKSLYGHELDNILHAFTHVSDKFGTRGSLVDVFELFGGQNNILVSDDASSLVPPSDNADKVASAYSRLNCSE